jgi:ribose transport system ATP-binding protein
VPTNQDAIFASLSGGNQQKAVLARSLRLRPRLLLLDDPTRGVDVGAKAAIYRVLHDAAEAGMAILVASTDFDELASLCNRVVVLKAGRVNGLVSGTELSGHRLLEQCYVSSVQAA